MNTDNKKAEKQFAIHGVSTDWNKYLDELHKYLTGLGFKKYKQNLKREDFAYWKKYDDKYQIGLFVYDFTKYDLKNKVSIQFECMAINIDGRCDLSVSKEIELPEFEKMAKAFYEAMSKYCY
jgi:hypothetical protein